MKIITKNGQKDYYDYLSGIWGVDPLIIYDRRHITMPEIHTNYSKISIYIGGLLIEGFFYYGKFYYGHELLKFGAPEPKYHLKIKNSFWALKYDKEYGLNNFNFDDLILIEPKYLIDLDNKHHWNTLAVMKTPIIDKFNTNQIENCPICVKVGNKSFKNCNLKDLNINTILSSTEVYMLISNWVSFQRSIAENRPDNRTNNEKIVSDGFNIKESFRPNIK